MGKTSQPLCIWVAPEWITHPSILDLIEKGHTVCTEPYSGQPDLILHPNAVGWDGSMWAYLEATVKAARSRKKRKAEQ